mmetsp:Transcript_3611/g.13937  ORF Transcript_3611/g.13937 Transcript_3611/m.13937 type:complete len:317 (-) Transcript_3611:237-1187(-)
MFLFGAFGARGAGLSRPLRRFLCNTSAARANKSPPTPFFERSASVFAQPSGSGTRRANVRYAVCDCRRCRGNVTTCCVITSSSPSSTGASRGRLVSFRHPTLVALLSGADKSLCNRFPSTSYSRPNNSTVLTSANPCFFISKIVFCTCSMHGENEQSTPSGRRLRATLPTHLCGPGKSKKTASARPAISFGNPSRSMSLCVTVTYSDIPFSANSSFAAFTRVSLNSYVHTRPVGATHRASACVRLPDPVPLSITTLPGVSSISAHTSDMSAAYRICVRCSSTFVHNSGVGAHSHTNPLPSRSRARAPNARPIQSSW